MCSWVVRTLVSGYKLENEQLAVSLRINGAGYWCSFRKQNHFFRRCLDGRIAIDNGCSLLSEDDARALHCDIHKLLTSLSLSIPLLNVAASHRVRDYEGLARLYQTTYPEEVPILPPDRYGDVVVQPAVGCPNGACTFCAFYQDSSFKVLSEETVVQHLKAIKQLFGDFPGGRDGIFIGSANAMALSQRRLLATLRLIEDELGVFKRGIAAFSDPDFSAQRTPEDWLQLREKGLRHLVIGLETGFGQLRGKLGKSANLGKVEKAVGDYQRAGISTGLTVLTGICQGEDQSRHRQETRDFIARSKLGSSDIVYLSPYESPDSDEALAIEEQVVLRSMLKEVTDAKVVPYQMNRFRYYS